MLTDETRYKILKCLEKNPNASQRELASELGVSLGKVNYCLNALIEKGFVKVGNFKRNPKKRAYAYLLTPTGLQEKTRMTGRFLRMKLHEFEELEREIRQLRAEAAGN